MTAAHVRDPASGDRRGVFITFEGIDGAGKSTHIHSLAEALRQGGHDVLVTREPGGTPLAETLRELVLHQSMDALTESLLVFAARRDHLKHCIEPALRAHKTVICDRFTDASFAYQGWGRGGDLQVLGMLEQWVQEGLQPDVTLLFDLPADEAARRRSLARQPDRFEAQDSRFFDRVRAGYAAREKASPQRFVRIDALKEPAEVWTQVHAAARQRGLL